MGCNLLSEPQLKNDCKQAEQTDNKYQQKAQKPEPSFVKDQQECSNGSKNQQQSDVYNICPEWGYRIWPARNFEEETKQKDNNTQSQGNKRD